MGTIASQITSLTIGYSTVYSDADQRKHQSSASRLCEENSPGTFLRVSKSHLNSGLGQWLIYTYVRKSQNVTLPLITLTMSSVCLDDIKTNLQGAREMWYEYFFWGMALIDDWKLDITCADDTVWKINIYIDFNSSQGCSIKKASDISAHHFAKQVSFVGTYVYRYRFSIQ